MSQESLVSVIIPCYNHAIFLTEAVESVINQIHQKWECIVVNDGSTDNTSEVTRHLITKYRFKISNYWKSKIVVLLKQEFRCTQFLR
jgi:glycosyltransferase involved in cell wall biosynthesis